MMQSNSVEDGAVSISQAARRDWMYGGNSGSDMDEVRHPFFQLFNEVDGHWLSNRVVARRNLRPFF